MASRMRIFQLTSCLVILLVSLVACGQQVVPSPVSADTTTTFSAPVDRGALDNPEIVEASGIAASRKNAGALWTHNDSGGAPKVYLIDDSGKNASDLRASERQEPRLGRHRSGAWPGSRRNLRVRGRHWRQ